MKSSAWKSHPPQIATSGFPLSMVMSVAPWPPLAPGIGCWDTTIGSWACRTQGQQVWLSLDRYESATLGEPISARSWEITQKASENNRSLVVCPLWAKSFQRVWVWKSMNFFGGNTKSSLGDHNMHLCRSHFPGADWYSSSHFRTDEK